MQKKQRNLTFLHDITDDDRTLLCSVLDWTELAEQKYVTKYSSFLDERQCSLCEKVLASVKYDNYFLWGGYESAERQMLSIAPPYSGFDKNDFPIIPISFSYRLEDKLTHRDFLGSLMALQISRGCVGDIIVGEGRAAVFLKDTVSQNVIDSLRKIGRTGVKCAQGFDDSIVPKREFQTITGTAASMRFDCILSLALKISREKAAVYIRSKKAQINHLETDSPDKLLAAGDVFSVRGCGKFLLKSVDGKSKKDRLHITVFKYI